MKVIMILTNGFAPDLRVYKEAQYITNQGYEVEILCWDRESIFKDKPTEQYGNIKIIRFFVDSKYGSGLKQIFKLLKFKKECKKYLKKKNINCDYIHCHDLDGMLVGYLLHKKNSKLIFDMHEFYNSGSYAKIFFVVKRLLNFLQNKSYKIIHVNDKQIENMSEKNKGKLIYLPNYPEESKFQKVEHIEDKSLRIMYAGYVRHLVPMSNLIKAGKNLENVEISIHGSGEIVAELEKMSEGCKNIELTGAFTHDQISNFYASADIVYIVYNKGNPNDETALPTKFFESIISGVPVIVSKDSLLEKTVKKYDIGFSVDGTNEKDIESLIKKIQDNREILEQKRKNIEKIKNKFVWEDVVKNLEEIYK